MGLGFSTGQGAFLKRADFFHESYKYYVDEQWPSARRPLWDPCLLLSLESPSTSMGDHLPTYIHSYLCSQCQPPCLNMDAHL